MLLCNDANGLLRVSVVQHSDNCSIINILFSMCYFVSSLRIYHVATFVCWGQSIITGLKKCRPFKNSIKWILEVFHLGDHWFARKVIILMWISYERNPWFPLARSDNHMLSYYQLQHNTTQNYICCRLLLTNKDEDVVSPNQLYECPLSFSRVELKHLSTILSSAN